MSCFLDNNRWVRADVWCRKFLMLQREMELLVKERAKKWPSGRRVNDGYVQIGHDV